MNKASILLIEFQNQWTEPGLYRGLINKQMTSRKVLENTRLLVKESRGKGITIIHAPLIIDPGHKKGWIAHLTFGMIFTKGTSKAAITGGLYENGDLVVDGRYAFDAFIGSDLERLLRDHAIEDIYFCGFTTDQCVAKTMSTALQKGFKGYLVSDCTATFNGFFQRKAENTFKGNVVDHRETLIGIRQ